MVFLPVSERPTVGYIKSYKAHTIVLKHMPVSGAPHTGRIANHLHAMKLQLCDLMMQCLVNHFKKPPRYPNTHVS